MPAASRTTSIRILARAAFAGILAAAISGGVAALPAAAASAPAVPQILPTPQQESAEGVSFPVTGTVHVVAPADVDAPAKDALTSVITAAGGTADFSATAPDGTAALYLGTHGDDAAADAVLSDLGVKDAAGLDAGGYVIAGGTVQGRKVLVLEGVDGAGTYYAVQSIRQIVTDGTVPAVRVRDWPLMSIRGAIEGFYGTPWSHQARMDQLAFDGEHKMNTYIYTPKDDDYLRAKWKELYPQDRLDQLKELVTQANDHHVNFTYALSPGNSICYSSQADLDATTAKFDQLRSIGVTSFYIALDDIDTSPHCSADASAYQTNGSYDVAKAQTSYLNTLVSDYIEPNHLQPLQTVPTDYSGSGGNAYKTEFGTTLDPSVRVQWTGEGIFSDQITLQSVTTAVQNYHTDHLYIWDNFPVNDGKRDRLFLNPLTGRDPDLYTVIDGFTSNPMIEPYASMIALAGYADYTWNGPKYDPQVTQKAIIDELAGPDQKVRDALTTFVDLNQYWPYRGGSAKAPALSADIAGFWKAYAAGDTAGMAPLEDRLATIASGPATLKKMAVQGFYSDAKPWIDAAAHWAKALQQQITALTAITAGHGEQSADAMIAAADQRAQALQKTVPDLVGSTVTPDQITPTVGADVFSGFYAKAVAAYGDWLDAAPLETTYQATASSSMGTYATYAVPNMADGDTSDWYWSNEPASQGDAVTLDLGTAKKIGSVQILQGRNASDGDMIDSAALQYSSDGTTWTTVASYDTAHLIDHVFSTPVTARYVRLVATAANPSNWVAIREFTVQPPGVAAYPATASSSMANYSDDVAANMTDGDLSTLFWSNSAPSVGSSVGVDLGSVVEIGSVDVHQSDSDTTTGDMLYHAKLQYSSDGSTWTDAGEYDSSPLISHTFSTPVEARYVRLVATQPNPGAKWVKIREFEVHAPSAGGASTDIALEQGSSAGDAFDGLIDTAAVGSGPVTKGQTLTRMFSSPQKVGSVTVIGHAAGQLQVQQDGAWRTLGTLDPARSFQEARLDAGGTADADAAVLRVAPAAAGPVATAAADDAADPAITGVRILFAASSTPPVVYEVATRAGGPVADDPLLGESTQPGTGGDSGSGGSGGDTGSTGSGGDSGSTGSGGDTGTPGTGGSAGAGGGASDGTGQGSGSGHGTTPTGDTGSATGGTSAGNSGGTAAAGSGDRVSRTASATAQPDALAVTGSDVLGLLTLAALLTLAGAGAMFTRRRLARR